MINLGVKQAQFNCKKMKKKSKNLDAKCKPRGSPRDTIRVQKRLKNTNEAYLFISLRNLTEETNR